MFDLPMASVHAFILTVHPASLVLWPLIITQRLCVTVGPGSAVESTAVHADPELVQRQLVSIICHIRK